MNSRVDRPPRAATWSSGSCLLFLGLLLAVPTDTVSSGEPYLVRDIRPGTVPGVEHGLASLTAVGERLFFTYDDGIDGRELWTSDRTTPGTRLVADIYPGPQGAEPRNLVADDGTLYFQALDGEPHEAIWASDGATEGTRRFAAMPEGSDVVLLAALNGRVFFSASGGLWASDGSAEGPWCLADDLVRFGRVSGFRFVDASPVFRHSPVVIDNRAYFTADSSETGVELWSSDGSPEGTRLVINIAAGPESANPSGLTVASGRLFFEANGSELWVSESPDDARLVATIAGGVGGLQAAGERVFFSDGFDSEIWVSDGTGEGTVLVSRVGEVEELVTAGDFGYFDDADEPGLWVTDGTPGGAVRFAESVDPVLGGISGTSETTTLGDTLFFFGLSGGISELWVASPESAFPLSPLPALPGLFSTREFVRAGDRVFVSSMAALLWVTDGTREGSSIISADLPGAPTQLTAAGDRDVYFTIGRQLWFSDGTDQRTVLVKELEPSPPVPASSNPSGLIAAGESVFFGVSRGDEPGLWASDGTEEGTTFVHGVASIRSGRAEAVNDHFFFWSGSARVGELWVSGGTLESTRRIGDTWIAVLDDRAFFGADGGLWVSDGTEEGTELFLETAPVTWQAVAGRRIFFATGEAGESQQLWVSDGTRERTTFLLDDLGTIRSFTAAGEHLFFSVSRPDGRVDLWISDGTSEGTRPIWESRWRWGASLLTAVGDRVFFSSWIGDGAVLWVADEAGAREVIEFIGLDDECSLDGEDCPEISGLFPASDRVFFSVASRGRFGRFWVSDGAELTLHIPGATGPLLVQGNRCFFVVGETLRVSDGTLEGTLSLGSWSGSEVIALGADRILYGNVDALHGRELWVSDGTPEGTRLLKDIRPGPAGSNPSRFRVQGDVVYFSADDGATGEEPWVSDGTARGTRRLADVVTGALGSTPSEFTLAGERLFFAADDGVHGTELWALEVESQPRFRRGDCDGDGRVEGQITDAVFLLSYNFLGGTEPPCLAACDANGDGRVDGQVTDAVYLLTWNFLGGPAPAEPFPGCGATSFDTDGSLGCVASTEGCR